GGRRRIGPRISRHEVWSGRPVAPRAVRRLLPRELKPPYRCARLPTVFHADDDPPRPWRLLPSAPASPFGSKMICCVSSSCRLAAQMFVKRGIVDYSRSGLVLEIEPGVFPRVVWSGDGGALWTSGLVPHSVFVFSLCVLAFSITSPRQLRTISKE